MYNYFSDNPYRFDNFWIPKFGVYFKYAFNSNGQFVNPKDPVMDIIHIGQRGYKLWSDTIGAHLFNIGWYKEPTSFPTAINGTEEGPGKLIRERARAAGLIGEEKGPIIKGVPESTLPFYYREYNNGALIAASVKDPLAWDFATRYGTAKYLSQSVTTKYLTDELNNLGAPRTDTMCWGPGVFCNTNLTVFDCGLILHDTTPFVGGMNVHAREVCPSLSDADKAKDPDFTFTDCPSGECGMRWFEFKFFVFRPIAGRNDTPFEFIATAIEPLPAGFRLETNGILTVSPTNAIPGSVRFKLKMKDSTGKESPDKEFRLSWGL